MRVAFAVLICFLHTIIYSQEFPRASALHGNVKSVREISYKARTCRGVITPGRVAYEYKGQQGFQITYEEKGRIISIEQSNHLTLNPFRTILYAYDSLGSVVKKTIRSSSGVDEIFTYRSLYNMQGQLIFIGVTLPDRETEDHYRYFYGGDTITEIQYNDTNQTFPGLKTRVLDHSWNTLKEWYHGSGRTVTYYTEFNYDSLNNKISEKGFYKGKLAYTMHWKYDSSNLMEREEFCQQNSRRCQFWTYKYEYDTHGNWIRRIEYRNGKAAYVKERTITYYE